MSTGEKSIPNCPHSRESNGINTHLIGSRVYYTVLYTETLKALGWASFTYITHLFHAICLPPPLYPKTCTRFFRRGSTQLQYKERSTLKGECTNEWVRMGLVYWTLCAATLQLMGAAAVQYAAARLLTWISILQKPHNTTAGCKCLNKLLKTNIRNVTITYFFKHRACQNSLKENVQLSSPTEMCFYSMWPYSFSVCVC